MNMKTIRTMASITTLAGILAACGDVVNPDFSDPVKTNSGSAGDLDLSRYVALGDSLTAGFADGALYHSGQLDSFPNILAQQFKKVGGGDFTQPLVNSDLGGLTVTGPDPMMPTMMKTSQIADTRLVLRVNPPGSSQPFTPITQNKDLNIPLNGVTVNVGQDHANPANIGPNNMGVPGAKSFHLQASGYGNPAGLAVSPATANPYFVRFSNPLANNNTVVEEALAPATPSFFTLWIGNNDILGYATGGGTGAEAPTYGTAREDITNPCVSPNPAAPDLACLFTNTYGKTVSDMFTANSAAKGVLINLPATTSIPFFTTVPHNAIAFTTSAEDQTKLAASNAGFTAYNSGLQGALGASLITAEEAARRTVTFATGQNPIVIEDETLTAITLPGPTVLPKYRPATAEDFILLTTSSKLGTLRVDTDPTSVIGVGAPLLDDEVLTQAEAAQVETARAAYNAFIKGLADSNPNLILLDAAAILADAADADGLDYGTGNLKTTFVSGGAFSLDGVHLTPRGNAVAANYIIDALNSAFGASIPKVDPNDYETVYFEFPAGFDFSQN